MPVAPPNSFLYKVTCMACDWSHIGVQRSDVIFAPDVCGKCGGAKLKLSTPSQIEAVIAVVQSVGLEASEMHSGWGNKD